MKKQLLGLCVSYTFGKSEQQVHLQPLCFIWSSGCSFGFCIPVSSLQYQLIGKLKGIGSHLHR